MGQKPERGAAFGIDQAEQLRALFVALPSAVGLEAEEFADAERGFAATEIDRRYAVTLEVFPGEVDAAQGIVVVDVADDVGELKREAEFFGKVKSAWIAEAEDMCAG